MESNAAKDAGQEMVFNVDAFSALGADNKNVLGKNLDQLINNAKKS